MVKIGVLLLCVIGCTSPDLFPPGPPETGTTPLGGGEFEDTDPTDPDPTTPNPPEMLTVQGQLCTVLILNNQTLACNNQGVFVNSDILANGQATVADGDGSFTATLPPSPSIVYNAVPSSQEFIPTIIQFPGDDLSPDIPMVRSFEFQDTLTNLGTVLQVDTAQVILRFVNVNSSQNQSGVFVETIEGGVNVPFYDVQTGVGWSSNGATGVQGSVLIPNTIVTTPTLTIEYSGDTIDPGAATILVAPNQITFATVFVADPV